MTRRERLTAIYEGQVPDRPAVRVWGLDFYAPLLRPVYGALRERAFAITDVVTETKAPFDMLCGKHRDRLIRTWEEPTTSTDWVDVVTELRTPKGVLREVYGRGTRDQPGYTKKHMVESADELAAILSLPYEPFPYTPDAYCADSAKMGDAGIVIQAIDNPGFAAHRLMGSEALAYVSMDARELLREAFDIFGERVREHVKQVLASGVRPVFGWVGPEVYIPPLMSVRAFEDFVFAIDKPTVDLIHDAGCRLWVHCHGDMNPVLERFADLGVDVLNPIEPPPTGRLTLAEAIKRVGDRMGLEGNIEVHDLMTRPRAEVAGLLEEAIAAGRGRRFILGLCSGYMENPEPSPLFVENLMFFIEEGVRLAESCR